MISFIAFLGNPGIQYEQTRHNAAWITAGYISLLQEIAWQRKGKGLYGHISQEYVGGKVIHLLKPLTFMNLSGEAVGEIAGFFKIPAKKILIVHDELELPTATLSLKWAGGLGGHNGLRSIKSVLGTADFWRLRIGIGRPAPKGTLPQPDIARYVLSPFSTQEYCMLKEISTPLNTLFNLLCVRAVDPLELLPKWTKVRHTASTKSCLLPTS